MLTAAPAPRPSPAPPDPRPAVLWWGRFDCGYSRNTILRRAFDALGWQVQDFRPLAAPVAAVHGRLRAPRTAALVWVPAFRQRDLLVARRHANRLGVPLCFDPLISAYDKQVYERAKFPPRSSRARRLLAWERAVFVAADRLVADTRAHASYFCEQFGVAAERISVIPVGADEALFAPRPLPDQEGGVEVLFYGSFLDLQGPEVIVRAALQMARPDRRVTLLGDGPLRERCVALAAGSAGIHFEPWLDLAALPGRIHRAHLLLGVFGAGAKAGRVIPNKVYQALACGRGVVTRPSPAYPEGVRAAAVPGLAFVAPDDPDALARALVEACASPGDLEARAASALAVYRRWFSQARVHAALAELLQEMGLPVPVPVQDEPV